MSNIATLLIERSKSQPKALALFDLTRSKYEQTRSAQMLAHGYDQDALTFESFCERFSRLSSGLSSLEGLAQGERVAICMENRPEFFDLLFACWCSGLCVVPINAKLHAKELLHILSDSGAKFAFLSDEKMPELRRLLSQSQTPQVRLMNLGSTAYASLYDHEASACVALKPTDLAWLFYTSGTTGRPKGAMLTHGNLWAMTKAYDADIEEISTGCVNFHAAPLSHGSGLYAIPHLLGGGMQVIFDGFEPAQILQGLRTFSRVSFFVAPTMLMRLVHAAPEGAQWPGLKTIIYGGAPMYVSDVIKALDCFGAKLYQLFGQGESPMTITGLSKANHLGARDALHLARLGSCGLPRTGVQVRVVDEAGRDVPIGEVGEIITWNETVMLGYWAKPLESALALRDQWLYTGDLGCLDQQGYLTLKDRSKDLIISGGSNIYPREVEEVLLLHEDVNECSVVGRAHPDWGEEVVAFVVSKSGGKIDSKELEQLCLDNIARFKRPKAYFMVDGLPKNNYGKVLKSVLRADLQKENLHE